jgi:glutaredoxin
MMSECRIAQANWSARFLAGALLVSLALGWQPVAADAPDAWVTTDSEGQVRVQLWFFWSQQCPHCLDARRYLLDRAPDIHWLQFHDLELTGHPDNIRLYQEMAAGLGREAQSVPALFFCGEMEVGWHSAQTTGARLLEHLQACRQQAMADGKLSTGAPNAESVSLPWLGELDTEALSLPVLTVALAAVDAFNPCAFFVLLFLLSLLVHLQSRGRMLLIGGVYVFISGAMYFAFMAAWLNLFRMLGSLTWVTAAAGAVALVLGAINVKDFVAFGRGVSLSMTESRRADIFRRGRRLLAAGSLPVMVGAAVVMAIAANLYELLCTAGFPMVYTRVLTLRVEGATEHYAWLALYNLVYVLPMAVIVLVFVRSMGGRKLGEQQGRLLKLLSGLMMLGLGTMLLVAPESLGNPAVAIGLVGIAISLTGVAAWWTQPSAGS